METALQRYDMTQDAMTPDSVVRQVVLIQDVMEKVMKEGEHWGKIPGCGPKPTLLKAGAEKLSLVFRLAPSYAVTQSDLAGNHREYYVKCTLTHIPTGKIFGEGVGACSTMEGKFRFRMGDVEFIGRPVPTEYWKSRDVELIGGRGFTAKKNPDTGKWEVARAGDKIEHDNPADYYNTVLKMAKKRAHIDAVLTATAASDIFTQDIEDMPEVIDVNTMTPKPTPETPDDALQGVAVKVVEDIPEPEQLNVPVPLLTPDHPLKKQIEVSISEAKINRELFKEWLFSIGKIQLKDEKPSLSTMTIEDARYTMNNWTKAQKAYQDWRKKSVTTYTKGEQK